MKKISVVVPCYNEEENVVPMSEELVKELCSFVDYDYEIIFIDNDSDYENRELLERI